MRVEVRHMKSVKANAVVLSTVLAGVLVLPVEAENSDAGTHKKLTNGAPDFPISSSLSRTVQTVTGINFLSQLIGSSIARSIIHRKIAGKVKVSVKVFSLTDLLAGKVKSVVVKGDEVKIRGVAITHAELATTQPVWFVYRKKEGVKTGLQRPILIKVIASMNEQDVSAALENPKVSKSLRGLKLDMPGLGGAQLAVMEPKVNLSDNRVKIDTGLITAGGAADTAVHLTISGTPELSGDSRIVLTGMEVASNDIQSPGFFGPFLETLFNPLVDFARMDRKDHAFRLNKLAVLGDCVKGEGTLVIAPKSDAKQNEVTQK